MSCAILYPGHIDLPRAYLYQNNQRIASSWVSDSARSTFSSNFYWNWDGDSWISDIANSEVRIKRSVRCIVDRRVYDTTLAVIPLQNFIQYSSGRFFYTFLDIDNPYMRPSPGHDPDASIEHLHVVINTIIPQYFYIDKLTDDMEELYSWSGVEGVTVALYHYNNRIGTGISPSGGTVQFEYLGLTASDLANIEARIIDGGSFTNIRNTVIPLRIVGRGDSIGVARRQVIWYIFDEGVSFATTQQPAPTQDISIQVNGELIPTIVSPTIIDGRTVVPVRAVTEALGASVDWDGSTRSVTIARGDNTIVMTIDSDIATVDAVTTTLDVAPILVNDTTMLPIRFIAESFDLDVEWDESSRTVIITTP